MSANILISHVPLPNYEIGSWNIMFSKLILHNATLFSHIICPKVEEKSGIVEYKEVRFPFARHKIGVFAKNYAYRNYYSAIKEILKKENFAVINIVDNVNALLTIHSLLKKDGLRSRVKIIYHLHGFAFNSERNDEYYAAIDTLFVLTKDSYRQLVDVQHAISCKIKQIYNGVDTNFFFEVDADKKLALRKELGFDPEKIYFLWLSQDRPKKGLKIILEAWRSLIKTNPNIELIVIGTEKSAQLPQVTFLGRFQNTELPKFYQVSDFYLFSTLCHEGHPLSLTEALISGNYCIASDIKPIGEILDYGNYGKLVTMPHDPRSWVEMIGSSIKEYIADGNHFEIPSERYSFTNWMDKMTIAINEEKNNFM